MKRIHRIGLIFLCLGLSVGCDQATKQLATRTLQARPAISFLGDVFRLQYAENRGAFLSLGASLPDTARFWVLNVCVAALLVGMLIFAVLSTSLDRTQVMGYAIIVGGGLSNWVDRAVRGGVVVDFMNMGIGPIRTGVFNVADLAIIGGIAILAITGRRRDRALRSAEPSPPG